jgi:hypothetical protein
VGGPPAWGLGRGLITLPHKTHYLLRITMHSLRTGRILNGTHQLLAYADDVNIVGENTDIIQRNTKALLDASKEVGLEVNPEKTKYIVTCVRFPWLWR